MNVYSGENLRKRLLSDMGLEKADISAEIRRDNYTNNKERLLRAVSWYCRAEKGQCEDEKVIFSYIAFNALYGQLNSSESTDGKNEGEDAAKRNTEFYDFLKKIADVDKDCHVLLDFMKGEKQTIKDIMKHRYLWKGYWDTLAVNHADEEWKKQQSDKRSRVEDDLQQKETHYPLIVLFQCFRVLRNQLMHGSAGYCDWYNRSQVKLCADFFLPLIGRMIGIMLDKPENDWGAVNAPPQGGPDKNKYNNKNKKAHLLQSEESI